VSQSEASFWQIRQNQRIRDHVRMRILTKRIVPAAAWLGISEATAQAIPGDPFRETRKITKFYQRRNSMDEWSVRFKPERRTDSRELRPQCNHSRVATLLFVRLFRWIHQDKSSLGQYDLRKQCAPSAQGACWFTATLLGTYADSLIGRNNWCDNAPLDNYGKPDCRGASARSSKALQNGDP